MKKKYVKSITFRCDEETDEFLFFLKHELRCSKQKVIEKCLLYAVSRPADVYNYAMEVYNDCRIEEKDY